ncbi:MAG: AAA family ATPase, partial [Thermoguttaceae bacterium]
ALRNLLYGIPGNTSDQFLHDYRNLRIGATLARRDGQQLEIVRRKGNKGTLLPPDEKEPLEESVLYSFLGGCDQAQFETMFGIDHPGLIAGGQDIIRGQGDIGHVLFAAGAGISDLRMIRNNLEKQAEDLFSPRGLKPAVNQALTELNRAKKLIRDSQLPSSEWQKHKAALDDKTRQLASIEEKLGELSRQKTRLQRLAGALPAIGRLRACEEKLTGLGDVPALSADFAENRRDTISRLETARQAEQDAVAEIARLDGQIAMLVVPEGLVSRASEIEAIYKELSVYRKARADLPGLIAKREHLEKESATLLHELRPELLLADADQLKLSRRQQVEVQNLGNRKEALEKQLAQARGEIADSQHSRNRRPPCGPRLSHLPSRRRSIYTSWDYGADRWKPWKSWPCPRRKRLLVSIAASPMPKRRSRDCKHSWKRPVPTRPTSSATWSGCGWRAKCHQRPSWRKFANFATPAGSSYCKIGGRRRLIPRPYKGSSLPRARPTIWQRATSRPSAGQMNYPIGCAAKRIAWPIGRRFKPISFPCSNRLPNSAANWPPLWINSNRLTFSGGRSGILPVLIRCRHGRCKPGFSGNTGLSSRLK